MQKGGHAHSHGQPQSNNNSNEIELQASAPNNVKDEEELTEVSVSKSSSDLTINKAVSTAVLEAGIVVHSVLIGMALGVSTVEFISLLIAISFHQTFEGMALGAMIAELQEMTMKKRFWLCFVYPVMTPIGIAIGIGIRNSFNSDNPNVLVVQGILDSISAGILFYNCYCDLFGAEIMHNPAFIKREASVRRGCFLAMYCGATAMALIGLWA